MADNAAFQRRQYEFAAHIRDPQANPCPADVEDRRMGIYRELFFNNIEGFLASGFPVLREMLDEQRWQAMARDFYARHRCRTPLFSEVAQEFLLYLQEERGTREGDPPFLLELCHYEWVELAVSISEADRDLPPLDPNGDLLSGHPFVSPLAWSLSYAFAVHRIGPEYQPSEPEAEPVQLVVYRDRADEVHFLEVNAVTQMLLQTLKENPGITGLESVERIADALQHPQPGAVIQAGSELLQDLRRRDIILGTT